MEMSVVDNVPGFQALAEKRDALEVQHESRMHVEFYMRSIQDFLESAKQERPVYKDIEYVRYNTLADRLSVWDEEVNDSHRRRWPDRYKKFKSGVPDDGIIGIPLKEWPQIGTSRINELNKMDIYSVEQLASVSDGDAYNLGTGGLSLVHQARSYLKSLKDTGHTAKLAAENVNLKQDMSKMQSDLIESKNMIAALQAQISNLANMNSQIQSVSPPVKIDHNIQLPSEKKIESKYKYKKKASEAFQEQTELTNKSDKGE